MSRWWIIGACTLTGALLTGGCSSGSEETLVPVELPVAAADGSAMPRLSGGGDRPLVLSWLEPAADGVALRFATLDASGWGPPRTVREGRNWFVNWADFPSVAPLSESLWGAHWLVKQPGGPYAYDVMMAISRDAGDSWSDDIALHDDATPTEHGFVSLFPWQDGAGAVWLDGRETLTDAGAMTLRAAVVGTDGSVQHPSVIDDLVCDCCPTAAAVASSGPVAVYRNRTKDEVRDIHVTRAIDGQWEPGRSVADDGWIIAGCPVNGPAIAAQGDRVVVAWYTAAAGEAKIRLAFSDDSAASFHDAIDVASGQVVGRVDVVLVDGGDAIVSWLGTPAAPSGREIGELRAQRISRSSGGEHSHVIARTGTGRPAGFPQMLVDGEHLVFAWTDTRHEVSQVRSARVASASIGR
ncbi:MAG: hypothetical protein ACNA7W_03030 [Pseudomonadales bacterium]